MSIPIPGPIFINTIVITSIVAVPFNEWNGVTWIQDDTKTEYVVYYNVTAGETVQGNGSITLSAADVPGVEPDLNALVAAVESKVAAQYP
jgi:hypothetical protein